MSNSVKIKNTRRTILVTSTTNLTKPSSFLNSKVNELNKLIEIEVCSVQNVLTFVYWKIIKYHHGNS